MKNYHLQAEAYRVYRSAIFNHALVNPGKCSICPETNYIVAHHEDYSKPLDVVWFCGSCHQRRHAELRRNGTARYHQEKSKMKMPDREYKAQKELVAMLPERCQGFTLAPEYWDQGVAYRQCRMGVLYGERYCWRHITK